MRGMCSIHDLRTVYSYDDLADMHEAINLQSAIENHNSEQKR